MSGVARFIGFAVSQVVFISWHKLRLSHATLAKSYASKSSHEQRDFRGIESA
jgi:hypothetical protein